MTIPSVSVCWLVARLKNAKSWDEVQKWIKYYSDAPIEEVKGHLSNQDKRRLNVLKKEAKQ